MTALLLHGIVRTDASRPADAPAHLRLDLDGLAALATHAPEGLDEADTETALQTALRHHQLLSAYALRADVLPVRFGAAFSGAAALTDALSSRHADFIAGLERVADRVEYVLSVGAAEAPSNAVPEVQATTGRGFLARKRAFRDDLRSRTARRTAFLQDLPDRLGPVTTACRPMPAAGNAVLARHALLVERAADRDLLTTAKTLAIQAETLGLAFGLRGPGPCYAFSDLDAASQDREDQFGRKRDGTHG